MKQPIPRSSSTWIIHLARLVIKLKVNKAFLDKAKAKVKTAATKALNAAGLEVRRRLTDLASKQLKGQNLALYVEGLAGEDSVTVQGEDRIVVKLTTDEAIGVEKGYPSYSIAQKLLAKATKHGKDGTPYVDVPFEHDKNELPPKVAAHMRALVKLSPPGAIVRSELKSPGLAIRKTLQPSGKRLRVQHVSGLHDDLLRIPGRKATKGKAARKAQYLTIRRVSARSDPSAWIHPGFRGVQLFTKVKQGAAKAIVKLMDDVFTKAMKK